MEQRPYGKTAMRVGVLGFGGSEIGYQGATLADVERLLGDALSAGLNVIDTAECYRDSEELIGRAVGHRRQEYYLFTKCGHAAGLPGHDWDPDLIARQIDRSLKRLRTDYVDVVHLHSCSLEILQRGDVITALERAKAQGKTRYIGYSGDGAAARWAVKSGRFDSLEISVNLADQEAIDDIIPEAVARGMGVVAKRPVANVAWRSGAEPPADPYARPYWERLRLLRYPFLAGDVKTAVATALRFVLAVPGVATMIVGTRHPTRVRENAALIAPGPLPEREYTAIRQRWHEVASPDWVGLT